MTTQQIVKDRKELSLLFDTYKNVFLVRGRHSYINSGASNLMSQLTEEMGLRITEFKEFSVNPQIEDVKRGVTLFENNKVSIIIAIGGGSVIDMAKLVRYYSQKQETPLLAIPTTAGTGAESTHFSVCYIDGIKHSIANVCMLPNFVALFPELTYNNPIYLTACSGFDALSQSIEAFWNINATIETDKLAEEAINLLFPSLPIVVNQPSDAIIYREKMLKGAHLAGKAINITRTTMPHALSYTLTSKYGYPHGHAVALTFPYFFNYYIVGSFQNYKGKDYKKYQAKMAKLMDWLSLGRDISPYQLMKNYIYQLGLGYDSLRPFDNETVMKGVNAERAQNSPFIITTDIIKQAIATIIN